MKKKYVKLIIVFILSYAFFGLIQFQTQNIVGTDGFYHIKYAQLTRTQGLIFDFPWWQTSVFAERFADEYLFYHILLIPFTFLNLVFAAKLSSVFFAALVVAVMYFVLEGTGVRWPFVWTMVFMLSSVKFLYRMCFPRAIGLSVIFLLLFYYSFFRKRYWAMSVIGFLFVWSFPGYYLIFGLLFTYILSNYLFHKNIDGRAIIFTVLGVVGGFVINPYFPANATVFYTHGIHMILSFLKDNSLNVITENKAPSISAFFKDSLIVHISFITGIIALFVIKVRCNAKKQKKRFSVLFSSFLIAAFFWFLGMRMVRSADYFVPFVFIFSASSVTIAAGCVHLKKKQKKYLAYALVLLLVLVGILGFFNVKETIRSVKHVRSSVRFYDCATWLKYEVPHNAIVFHSSWDTFPELFFYNHENHYLYGLTPDFIYVYDQRLGKLYDDIRNGRIKSPSKPIMESFDSTYVFVDNRYKTFESNLRDDTDAKLLFTGEECRIYGLY